jgi:HAD superfamily hydrolase (TIGR01509 family)
MTDTADDSTRALIFDFDGTLADTMPTHFTAWEAALKPYGLVFTEERFYQLGGWSTRRLAELLIEEAGSPLSAAQLVQEKEAEFQRQAQRIQPIVPVVEIARRHRGVLPLAVATSGLRSVIAPILSELNLANWFDAVVTADDVVHQKPAPDLFLEAARRLNVAPSFCRVYEDTDAGIEAARRAGMPFVDVRLLIRAST